MKPNPFFASLILASGALILPAAAQEAAAEVAPTPAAAEAAHDHAHDHAHAVAKAVSEQPELVAVLSATEGSSVTGWLKFQPQADNTVKVSWDISGLTPDAEHAFHVHEFGDISAKDGTAAGGHFNPEGHDHGLPGQEHRHAGDFGNLKADAAGRSVGELSVDNIQLTEGTNAIAGRGLIVHAKADDGGQPTGNAGDRIAQAVIGVAQVEKAE